MDECSRVLERVDFDLYAMLGSNDSDVYSNVLNSFVGITCTQVGVPNTDTVPLTCVPLPT